MGRLKVKVEEYPHAYLVRGTRITIDQARRALVLKLGKDKKEAIYRMPCRPLWTGEMGDPSPTSAVAFYFNMGEMCESGCAYCRKVGKDKYKP